MDTNSKMKIVALSLRWIARATSLLSIGLILMFLLGESFDPARVRAREWIGLAFFPVGVATGMIVAWWKEGFGAAITLASLVAFYGIYGWLMGSNVKSAAFIFFATPGFLFLISWLLSRSHLAEVTAQP